jgi:4-hydroxyproline epimerase
MSRHLFTCIDAHTCGNPVRVVVDGGPELHAPSMEEKRLEFLKHHDWIRKGLMFEPRGHDMMSGSILYPPADPQNDVGILFIETSGCLPMCGHGTIGTVTVILEEGLLSPKTDGELRLETPAGLVQVRYVREDEKVKSVKLVNVPSYLDSRDLKLDCPGLGNLTVDVAFGGNFYAIVDPQQNFSGIESVTAADLIRWSPLIRKILNEQNTFQHVTDARIKGLSHILWAGRPIDKKATARNAVFYGDKAIDRSPCGTGTSARMAQWVAKGLLKIGEEFIHESIIGSQFVGRVEDIVELSGRQAIIPSIEGWARITGHNKILIDTDDPYAFGFQVI